MPDEGAPRQLRLREALIEWCDPVLVEAVRAEERRHTPYEMAGFRRGCLSATEELSVPRERSWVVDGENLTALIEAWHALERDLKRRLEDGELHLSGVQLMPQRATERQAIPGVWAADFSFDLQDSAISFRDQRFGAVTVSRSPACPSSGLEPRPPGALPPITAENVRQLSDDEVLLLLEDHSRRVIEGPDARLFPPGKISLLPIIKGKMRHRAEHGELLPTLSAESRWLKDWISSKVTFHQLPTSLTIGKVLSSEYGILKTRSNAAITRFKT